MVSAVKAIALDIVFFAPEMHNTLALLRDGAGTSSVYFIYG